MGTRSVWKGSISLGLLNILVKMHTGARDERVGLHMYHRACNSPVNKPNRCQKCQVDLQESEIFKGFAKADGKVVPLTKEEIKAITPATEHAMEISQCIPAAKIPQMFYAENFYLVPDVGADKAYRLLALTLDDKKCVALAQLCKGNREHVAMILPKYNDAGEIGLALHFMWYADEVAKVPEFESLKPIQVSATERKLAGQLIDSITEEEFHPEEFEDGYNMRLKQLIGSKIDDTVDPPAPVQAAKLAPTLDIEKALAASLAKSAKRKQAAPAPAKGGKKGKVA